MAGRTPSQTIGPFFHEGLRWKDAGKVAFAEKGRAIVLAGKVLDGAGEPVGDALVETWQRSATGAIGSSAQGDANPHGFGRVATAADGTFRLETTMPGGRIPCLDVTILARGLLKALRTRVYLCDESLVRTDPALEAIAASPRVATLVARLEGDDKFRWDVRLQGAGETVFFT
ncbi:MAG TPA: protocatechuate 3,4-dioxygenase subunit alpha [Usitatibacter sp.]|nr:protocatechuate 3,4-dioxygenase subunit alpha [Usitatibacter sp.]